MNKYINFFPGNLREEQELSLNEDATYEIAQDLGDFLDSMIKGYTASMSAEGIKEALEDGEVLGQIRAKYKMDEDILQNVVEELHAAL